MLKLMVVDDERNTRATLCDCFPWSEVGFTVAHQADNGVKALQYLLGNPVDALLCDIRMPMMSGLELLQEIQRLNLPLQVVIMSAYREFEYAQRAIEFGVRRFIVKPVKFEQLYESFALLARDIHAAREKASEDRASTPQTQHGEYADPLIQKIVRYIALNYRDANLEEAARLVHMNPSYLSHVFKKQTDVNFSSYLYKVRMEKAASFIQENRFPIGDISEMVGYTNAKNFTRSFKKFYGKTPREYRQ